MSNILDANDIDVDLSTLNDRWHKLYNLKSHLYVYGINDYIEKVQSKSKKSNNKKHFNYFQKIFPWIIKRKTGCRHNTTGKTSFTDILDEIAYDLCDESLESLFSATSTYDTSPYNTNSYPRISITHSWTDSDIDIKLSPNADEQFGESEFKTYQGALQIINELIWAISVHTNSYLGTFMADWNYVISAEQKNTPIHLIVNHLNKFKKLRYLLTKPINNFTMNYRKLDMLLIHDAKYVLSKLNDNDKLVLIPIIHFNWDKFTIDSILNNVSVIANGCACYDINVVHCLRECHLINGRDLQKKLVLAMKNNNDKNYSVRKVMSLIYKIKNKSAIYHYSNQGILHNPIHKVSTHALKRIITADIDRNTTKKKLDKLVQKRNKVTNQIKALEHK